MREIKADEFESEVIESEVPVIVDFFGCWCKPCLAMMPTLEAFAAEHPEIKVVKIDVDEARDLTVEYGVRSIPKLIYFVDGNEVREHTGSANKEMLLKLIETNTQ
jgi:thioredoxin 1